jgi:hypothetical protein
VGGEWLKEYRDSMIPNAPKEVNKFDSKVPVLFDTRTPPPYKETVIERGARSAGFDLVAATGRRGAAESSVSRRALAS